MGEDAHILDLDIGDGNAIFGIYDGHGGPEVAIWVSRNLVKILKEFPAYQEKDYK